MVFVLNVHGLNKTETSGLKQRRCCRLARLRLPRLLLCRRLCKPAPRHCSHHRLTFHRRLIVAFDMASRKQRNGAVAAATTAASEPMAVAKPFLSGAKAHLNPENKNNWSHAITMA